jgi:membrane protease YdiL (CAAX protease family)
MAGAQAARLTAPKLCYAGALGRPGCESTTWSVGADGASWQIGERKMGSRDAETVSNVATIVFQEAWIMGQRVMMFALPLALVVVGRLGVEGAFHLLRRPAAATVGLAVYYVAIAASVLLVRKVVAGAQRAPSLYSGRRPAAWRVILAVVVPALPVGVLFVVRLAPVAPAIVAAILAFSAINACFEETFWRGLMAHLPAPDWIRILYPAAAFAFMHWFNMAPYVPLTAGTYVVMVASTFALGIVWMWFQLRERSLLFPIASHFAIDAFALLALAMQAQKRLM